MSPLGDAFGVIPAWIVMWVLVCLAFGLFGYRLSVLIRTVRLGRPENRFGQLTARLWVFVKRVLFQSKVLRDPFPGVIHVVIFIGFILFALAFLFMLLRGLFPSLSFPDTIDQGNAFALLLDIVGALTIAAILVAAFRRWVLRPSRLDNTRDAGVILALIFAVVLTYMIGTAARLVADSAGSVWSPVSALIAGAFEGIGMSADIASALHAAMWWSHVVVVLFFMNYIVFSKHMHLIFCPANEFFEDFEPMGRARGLDLGGSEAFGVTTIGDYTWKQLLDLLACTECGRCKENCPTSLTGKPLVPKDFIHDLKTHLLQEGPKHLKGEQARGAGVGEVAPDLLALVGNAVAKDAVWACTTCGFCQEHCPVSIEHMQKIIDLRRGQVLMEAEFPPELKSVFRNAEMYGNPWAISNATRPDWAAGLGVKTLAENPNPEVLYWVGCTGSFDDRNKQVSAALARVLAAGGVDFAILGAQEKCCGDPMRRAGNEYVFAKLAEDNVRALNEHKIKKIVAHCPHCVNTLRNEYQAFGGDYEVSHYIDFVFELVRTGKLKVDKPIEQSLVYHDPCYLGRYSGSYDNARALVRSIPSVRLIEMNRNRERSLCCGGGGGRAWMSENIGSRINVMRLQEALEGRPDVVGTGCPYCLQMFEDAIVAEAVGTSVKAMDLIEVVAKAVQI